MHISILAIAVFRQLSSLLILVDLIIKIFIFERVIHYCSFIAISRQCGADESHLPIEHLPLSLTQ